MADLENRTGSVDPSLTVGSIYTDDELLRDVPEEVVKAVGKEDAKELESACITLASIDVLRRTPNPFDLRSSERPDFTFMRPSQAEQVEQFISQRSTLKGRQEMLTGFSAPLTRRSNKIWRLAAKAYDTCRKTVDETSSSIDRSAQDIKEQVIEPFNNGEEILDTEAIRKQTEVLTSLANRLPSNATLRVIEDLFTTMRAMEEKAAEMTLLRANRALLGRYAGRAKLNEDHAKWLRDYGESALRVGSATYDLMKPTIQLGEAVLAAAILIAVDKIKESLARQIDEGNLLKTSQVDEYLISKMRLAQTALSDSDPEILNLPIVKKALRGISAGSLTDAKQSRENQERLEQAAGFSHLITEARDILNAPRRLEIKNQQRIQEIADSLYVLSRTGESPLTAEENGIVVSIIAGRFEAFSRTLARIQTAQEDEQLATIERTRPEVVKRLREFDLSGAMYRIKAALDQSSDALSGVLSSEEFVKLELGVEKFYEIAENIESPTAAQKIEDVLDNGELFSRLDWTVLPRGELELEEAAREIVAMAQERAERGARIQIDLTRLQVLKNIKEKWGADRCYYARGTLSGRGKVRVEGAEQPDEYIVLVLQNLDGEGHVITEHAVAESPIAGHNATYMLRGDVTEFSWRDVYSLPKKDARALGTRAVKHTKGDGSGLVNVMTTRISYLLSCEPSEFSIIRFSGRYIRLARQIGEISSAA